MMFLVLLLCRQGKTLRSSYSRPYSRIGPPFCTVQSELLAAFLNEQQVSSVSYFYLWLI